MKRSLLFLIFLTLCGTVALFGQTTIYVNSSTGSDENDGLTPETAKATIQASILAAGSNGIVLVAQGVGYEGPFYIDSTGITIQAEDSENRPTLTSEGTVFYVNPGVVGVSIKDLIIITGGVGHGIEASSGNDKLSIMGNDIQSGFGNGIMVQSGADSIVVSENTVHDCDENGMILDISFSTITGNQVTNSGLDGIKTGGFTNTYSNNISNDNGQNGINIYGGDTYHTLSNNTANGNGWSGIYIANENGLTLIENTSNGNGQHGIHLYSSANFLLERNTTSFNTQSGIYLENSVSNDLFFNFVTHNTNGIVLAGESSTNLVRGCSVDSNGIYGIYIDGGYRNTIWNNEFVGNGTSSTEDVSAGIYVNDGYENAISLNWIIENDDWGVYFAFNEDNVVAMNHIYNNNTDGGEGGAVYHSGSGNWLNAQHNWWGQSTGPTEADLSGPGRVITFYHKTSESDIVLPTREILGPVYIDGVNKAFPSLGDAAAYVGEYGLTDALVQVRTAGLFENDLNVGTNGTQITGAGMNQSYLYLPYTSVYFSTPSALSVLSGFDLDAGSFFDPVLGTRASFNYFGSSENSVIDVNEQDVLIANNRIRGGWHGVYIGPPAFNVTVQANEIIWNYFSGVYISSYSQTISDNLIYQNGFLVPQGDGDQPSGIYVYYGDNTITGNKIANNAGNGITATDYYNTIENNIVGAVELAPSVLLPEPIKWDSINVFILPGKISGKVAGQNAQTSSASVNRVQQNRERLARFLPQLKAIEPQKDGKPLTLVQLKALGDERKAALAAEWKLAAPAYYAELKKIKEEERTARAELRKQRNAERKSSTLAGPSFKSAGVATTIPTLASQSMLTGNSTHGMRITSYQNTITGNTITENGLAFARDVEDAYRKPEPAGIEISYSYNYIADNTISNNWFAGIKIHNNAYQNVIWRNTISFNGHKTEGDGAGIFFGKYGGYGNSISTNDITDNVGHGVRIDSLETELVLSVGPSFSLSPTAYDNAIVYNNITGNTVSGITAQVSEAYPYTVNAQYNYWGDASGPAATSNPTGTGQSVSDNVSYLFYRSTPVPPVTADAPLMGDGTIPLHSFEDAGLEGGELIIGEEITGASFFQNPANAQLKTSSLTYSVLTLSDYTGLVASFGLNFYQEGMTLTGGGKDETGSYKSYVFLPNSPIQINADNVSIEYLDLDGGGMLDLETGNWLQNLSSGYNYTLISVFDQTSPRVRFNRIRGSGGIGIYLTYVASGEVNDNELFWHRSSGISDYEGFESPYIVQNKIFENGDIYYEGPMAGIVLEYTEGAFVAGNEVFNNVLNGIYLRGSLDNIVVGNTVHSNGALGYFMGEYAHPSGIVLPMDNANNLIEQNTVVNNVRHGIRIGAPYSEIPLNNVGNIIQNNLVGAGGVSPSIKPINITDLQTKVHQHGSQTFSGLLQPGRSNFSSGALAYKQWRLDEAVGSPDIDQLRRRNRARREESKKQGLTLQRQKHATGAMKSDKLSVSKTSPTQAVKLRLSSARSSYAITKQAAVVTELPGNWETGISLVQPLGAMVLGNMVVGNGWGVENLENPPEQPAGVALSEGVYTFMLGNMISDNTNAGIYVDSSAFSGATLNVISGNEEYGVFNATADSSYAVFAQGNYWGAANGPSGSVNDPVTGLPANGEGDAISANILFDPFAPVGPEQLSAALLYPEIADERMLGGIQFDFANTGTGGIIAAAQFNSAPVSDPIPDPEEEGEFYSFAERYWEITDSGVDSFEVSLTFSYAGLSNGVYRLYYRQNFAPADSPWTAFPVEQTVQNSTEKTVTANGMTGFSQWALVKVANAAPTVSLIAPASGSRGAKVAVNFTGEDFDLLGTTVDFGSNIAVDSLTALSPTGFTAHIALSVSAQTGMRGVTVTTAAGISEPDSFMVNNPVPTITSVSPTGLSQGGSTTVTISGLGLLPGATGTKVSFGEGITVGEPTLNGANLEVNVEVSPSAALGTRNVSVTNDPPGGGTNQLVSAFTVSPPTSVERLDEVPTEFNLLQNFPNPFNPTTTIRFSVPEASTVRMVLYNMLGSEVKLFVNETLAPGVYQYHVRAEDLPSGMYIYRISATPLSGSGAKPYSSARKLVLVK